MNLDRGGFVWRQRLHQVRDELRRLVVTVAAAARPFVATEAALRLVAETPWRLATGVSWRRVTETPRWLATGPLVGTPW